MVNAVTVEKILQILEELAKEGIKTDKIPVSSCTIYRAIEKQGFNAEQIVTRNKMLNGQINIGNKLAYIRAKEQELSEEAREKLITYGIFGEKTVGNNSQTQQFIEVLEMLEQASFNTKVITTKPHTLREELERQGFNADEILAKNTKLDGEMNIGDKVSSIRAKKQELSEEERKDLIKYGILGKRETKYRKSRPKIETSQFIDILKTLKQVGLDTGKITTDSHTLREELEKQGFNADGIVAEHAELDGEMNIGNKVSSIRAKEQELSEEERKDLIKYGILGKRETKHRNGKPKLETSQFIDILEILKQVGLDTGKITTDSHTLREELEKQGFNADGIVAEHAELDGKMNIGNRVGIERRAKTKHSEEETKILTEYGILGERKTGRKQKKTKSKEVSEEKLIKEIAKLAMKRNVKMSQLQEICDSYGVAIEDVLAYIQQLEIPFENDLE